MEQAIQQVISQAKEALQRSPENEEQIKQQLEQAIKMIEESMNQQGQTYASMLRDVRNSLQHAVHACNQPNNEEATDHSFTQAIRACEQAEETIRENNQL